MKTAKQQDTSHYTDEELVKLTITDQEFFRYLIERYEQKLMRYICRISDVSTEDAEDILQEIFIKSYQNLRGFDTDQKFSSWVYRIAHNETISYHRKKHARPEGHQETGESAEIIFDHLASEFDIRASMHQKEMRSAIERILQNMDQKYREVLILKYLEEKEYQEIAFILRKPMGTVATLLNRAKKQFKIICTKEHPEFFSV